MKTVLKILLSIVLVVILAVGGFVGYASITEYRPADVEDVDVVANVNAKFDKQTATFLTMNVGYCALGEESDFFMDGGKEVRPKSKDTILKNYDGIKNIVISTDADFTLMQEVDFDSKRSYRVDEVASLRSDVQKTSVFAYNYRSDYVPYPWPTIGRVRSGLLTFSSYNVSSASRVNLPCPFKWPVSLFNLKRGLLLSRVPMANGKELVVINLHLEAYDDGEGKIAQTKLLMSVLQAEYQKGNYVVAGGDFNQVFPGTLSVYPNTHPDLWSVGALSEMTDGWQYAFDQSLPTCRLLNQPYDPTDTVNTQYYVIDGYVVSPNLTIEQVQTLDAGFQYTDHNPVKLTVRFN